MGGGNHAGLSGSPGRIHPTLVEPYRSGRSGSAQQSRRCSAGPVRILLHGAADIQDQRSTKQDRLCTGSFPDRHLPRPKRAAFACDPNSRVRSRCHSTRPPYQPYFPRRAIPTRTEAADTPHDRLPAELHVRRGWTGQLAAIGQAPELSAACRGGRQECVDTALSGGARAARSAKMCLRRFLVLALAHSRRQRRRHELVEIAVQHLLRIASAPRPSAGPSPSDRAAARTTGSGGPSRCRSCWPRPPGARPRASAARPRRGAPSASGSPWRGSGAGCVPAARRRRCRSADG